MCPPLFLDQSESNRKRSFVLLIPDPSFFLFSLTLGHIFADVNHMSDTCICMQRQGGGPGLFYMVAFLSFLVPVSATCLVFLSFHLTLSLSHPAGLTVVPGGDRQEEQTLRPRSASFWVEASHSAPPGCPGGGLQATWCPGTSLRS